MVYNRECAYCGSKYYVCNNCVKKGSWKTICCSRECFQRLADSKVSQKVIENISMNTLMKVTLKNDIIVDIIGYDFELGRFDAKDGTTYSIDDIKYVRISTEELKELVEDYYKRKEHRENLYNLDS